MLTPDQKSRWKSDGFFIVPTFESQARCRALHDRVVEIARLSASGFRVPNVLIVPEKKPNPSARNPEDEVAKIFRLHRDATFRAGRGSSLRRDCAGTAGSRDRLF